MKRSQFRLTPIVTAALVVAAAAAVSSPARAALVVSEVAPWSSGTALLAADWFELSNTGASSVSLAGWKIDDNSNSFAAAVALSGVTSIAPGESVIFIETANLAGAAATFKSLWFGASAPAGLQIGAYSGAGVGLGTGGDAVNIYDASGVLQANVIFGSSPSNPLASFDNAAGLNGAITQLSAAGVNGAFVSAGDSLQTGSPGSIAAVPESGTLAMWFAGLVALSGLRRIRR